MIDTYGIGQSFATRIAEQSTVSIETSRMWMKKKTVIELGGAIKILSELQSLNKLTLKVIHIVGLPMGQCIADFKNNVKRVEQCLHKSGMLKELRNVQPEYGTITFSDYAKQTMEEKVEVLARGGLEEKDARRSINEMIKGVSKGDQESMRISSMLWNHEPVALVALAAPILGVYSLYLSHMRQLDRRLETEQTQNIRILKTDLSVQYKKVTNGLTNMESYSSNILQHLLDVVTKDPNVNGEIENALKSIIKQRVQAVHEHYFH